MKEKVAIFQAVTQKIIHSFIHTPPTTKKFPTSPFSSEHTEYKCSDLVAWLFLERAYTYLNCFISTSCSSYALPDVRRLLISFSSVLFFLCLSPETSFELSIIYQKTQNEDVLLCRGREFKTMRKKILFVGVWEMKIRFKENLSIYLVFALRIICTHIDIRYFFAFGKQKQDQSVMCFRRGFTSIDEILENICLNINFVCFRIKD